MNVRLATPQICTANAHSHARGARGTASLHWSSAEAFIDRAATE